jgi:hypothetical protein
MVGAVIEIPDDPVELQALIAGAALAITPTMKATEQSMSSTFPVDWCNRFVMTS